MRTAVLLAAALPFAAAAQTIVPQLDQSGRPGEIARLVYEKASKQFTQADADHTGKLTVDEVRTVSQFKAQSFAQFDKDGDGLLDWNEFVGHDRWQHP